MIVWHIGDVIRKLREAKHWNQKVLAHHAAIKPNTLGNIERGFLNFEWATLSAIARALGLTAEELTGQMPHAPEVCPRVTAADVSWPDDALTRALGSIWIDLEPADRQLAVDVIRRLSAKE